MPSALVRIIRSGLLLVLAIYGAVYANPAAGQGFTADQFVWSYSGPISGRHCIQINEPSAPRRHDWGDNYLCTLADWELQWSYRGPIAGMRCTLVNEPSEPNRRDWNDNYLCVPNVSPLFLYWSYKGNSEHDNCIKINEPSEPQRHDWDDNYLCIVDERAGITREDWTGSYSGVTDGKKILLNIRTNNLLGNWGLTLEFVDPNTRDVVSKADVEMGRGDRNHELRNLEFKWVSDPDRAAKTYPRLYLHNRDKRVISGYSLYNGNTFGAIFRTDGFESSLNPRPYRTGNYVEEICNWTGDYEGYLDGRPLNIKIEEHFTNGRELVSEALVSFSEGHLQYRTSFEPNHLFGRFESSANNPAPHHYRLNSIEAYRSGRRSLKIWPNFHLHTWDTSYISGTSEWRGREFGIAFKRIGTQEGADRSFAQCLEGARRPLPSRPEPEPPPPPRRAVCEDGIDNDRDGVIDFPADPGCESRTDSNEFNPAFARYSEIEVTNCHSARAIIHIWRKDLTSSSSWSEIGSSAHQYDAFGTCPRAGAETIDVSLPSRDHLYLIRAVSPSATGCGGRNDPDYLACERESVILQANPDAAVGRALIN